MLWPNYGSATVFLMVAITASTSKRKGVPIREIRTIPRNSFLRKIGDPSPPSQSGNCLFGKVPTKDLGLKRSKHSGFGSRRQLLCEMRVLKAFSLSSGMYLREKNFTSWADCRPHVINYYVRSGCARSNLIKYPDIGIMYLDNHYTRHLEESGLCLKITISFRF